jgi:hypothetical protein
MPYRELPYSLKNIKIMGFFIWSMARILTVEAAGRTDGAVPSKPFDLSVTTSWCQVGLEVGPQVEPKEPYMKHPNLRT